MRRFDPGPRRPLALGLVAALSAASASGCRSLIDTTGAVAPSAAAPSTPSGVVDFRAQADRWASAYDANPGEKVASINYARALRGSGRYSEAVAVMRVAAIKAPKDYEVLGAYGKALADDGDLQQAKDVLAKAYPLERPDWTILSVQGVVEDKLGNFADARRFYDEALKIAPGEPSVLSNLGLSYALDRQLPQAEQALREAAASPAADARARQNLSFVLALEGKFGEAEAIGRQDMSAEQARANVLAIQTMMARGEAWKALATKAGGKTHAAPKASADPNG